jgi:hypothetical protein
MHMTMCRQGASPKQHRCVVAQDAQRFLQADLLSVGTRKSLGQHCDRNNSDSSDSNSISSVTDSSGPMTATTTTEATVVAGAVERATAAAVGTTSTTTTNDEQQTIAAADSRNNNTIRTFNLAPHKRSSSCNGSQVRLLIKHCVELRHGGTSGSRPGGCRWNVRRLHTHRHCNCRCCSCSCSCCCCCRC